MPTKTKAVVIPADPDDLICDTCPNRYPYQGETLRTFESARVKGWHIYQQVTARGSRSTGESSVRIFTKVLCPECVGTPRSKLPPPPAVLEGQADILEDLNYQVTPVEKEKKPPKKGVN